MKLILTRHGETVDNTLKIIQGHNQGVLTDEGTLQAKKLALRLKNEKIHAIYSSDLKRAADTARIIAKYHRDANLQFTPELRERDYGSLSGKSWSENVWNNLPDDVEKPEVMEKRVKGLLDKVYLKYPQFYKLYPIQYCKLPQVYLFPAPVSML